MSDTDAAEANRRAEWLHKHKAPKDWIVLTTSEVSVIREELLAVERERDEARKERDQLKEALIIMENLLKPGIELFPEIGEILKRGAAK